MSRDRRCHRPYRATRVVWHASDSSWDSFFIAALAARWFTKSVVLYCYGANVSSPLRSTGRVHLPCSVCFLCFTLVSCNRATCCGIRQVFCNTMDDLPYRDEAYRKPTELQCLAVTGMGVALLPRALQHTTATRRMSLAFHDYPSM